MDYNQLREILVNTEALYNLWKSTGLGEESFIRMNASLIKKTEKARLQAEQTKARQKRFFERQRAQGRRHLTAMVSASTYDNLCRLRDHSIQAGSPKNLGEVLDELLSVTGSKPDPKPKQAIVEIQTEIPAPAPTLVQDQAADKLDVIKIMAEHRKAGRTWPDVAKKLNSQGIFTSSGCAWTGPNCQTFFKRSQK